MPSSQESSRAPSQASSRAPSRATTREPSLNKGEDQHDDLDIEEGEEEAQPKAKKRKPSEAELAFAKKYDITQSPHTIMGECARLALFAFS